MAGPRLTIDANCVINLFDRDSQSATSVEELQALIRYGLDGKAEIAVTTRLEADLGQDKNEERRRSLVEMLKMFPVISSIGRWDRTRWDTDVWLTDESARQNDEIQKILSPGLKMDDRRYSNKINDIDHLTGHLIDKRDIFVTDDTGIVRRRDALRGLGIIVMTPAECVRHIDGIQFRSTPRSLPSDAYPPEFRSPALHGSVEFDYSNNNGRFAIGDGQHLFETYWSKASNVSIHAYHDAPSISALALAKGASELTDITDAEGYDFSSRTRTPRLGEIVIWRNVNGLYAATKIIRIKDDSRGDDRDELGFEYVILARGERAFSAK